MAAMAADPYRQLKQRKDATGQKVIGCFPMYVPEELIHAAGMLPAVIFGSHQAISEADSRLQPYVCSVVRSGLDRALRGELGFMDGFVFPDICDAVQCLSDIWRRNLKPGYAFNFVLPAKVWSAAAEEYMVLELGRMRASLEELAGRKIGDDDLRHSIAVCNRQRSLLRQLYGLRRERPGAIKAAQMVAAVVAGMIMPKEEHSALLERLIAQVGQARPRAGGMKVVLSGSLCDDPAAEVLEMVEELGGVVVDDDLYTGYKYFASDAPTDGDPLAALAQRHFNGAPCPTRHDLSKGKDPADHLLRMVEAAGAQAAIILLVKFCEPHGFDYPYLKQRLEGAGVPHFLIEMEHEMSNLGQVRTRLQAFMEMLGGE